MVALNERAKLADRRKRANLWALCALESMFRLHSSRPNLKSGGVEKKAATAMLRKIRKRREALQSERGVSLEDCIQEQCDATIVKNEGRTRSKSSINSNGIFNFDTEDKHCAKSIEKLSQFDSKLQAALFRKINEKFYTCDSQSAAQMLKKDSSAFLVYHRGYQTQMSKWPVKPLQVIIQRLKNRSADLVVADIGCGQGDMALSLAQKVHSFDLQSVKGHITECDAAKIHTVLPTSSVDVCVFCLSLMGTNMKDFLISADKVLRKGGALIVAEVSSRFELVNNREKKQIAKTDEFVSAVTKFGYKLDFEKDYGYFVLFEFTKHKLNADPKSLKDLKLKPCIYKKR